jgi:hypothetical protein
MTTDRLNLKELEIELNSTNDLSYPCFKTHFQYGSNMIQLLQLIIFVLLIHENSDNFNEHATFSLVLGKVFIFFYLFMSLPDTLSSTLKLKMRLHTPSANREEATLLRGEDENKSILQSLVDSFKFLIILAINWLIGCIKILTFSLKEVFCPQDHVLIGKKVPLFNRLQRLLSVQLEACNYMLSIIAVVIITEQQDTLINILFNFAGVLVVSSLDEVLILSYPNAKAKVFVNPAFVNVKPSLDEPCCEIGLTALTSGFVLLLFIVFRLFNAYQ